MLAFVRTRVVARRINSRRSPGSEVLARRTGRSVGTGRCCWWGGVCGFAAMTSLLSEPLYAVGRFTPLGSKVVGVGGHGSGLGEAGRKLRGRFRALRVNNPMKFSGSANSLGGIWPLETTYRRGLLMARFEMSGWLAVAGSRAVDSFAWGAFARLARLWSTPRLSGLIRSQGAAWRSVDDGRKQKQKPVDRHGGSRS